MIDPARRRLTSPLGRSLHHPVHRADVQPEHALVLIEVRVEHRPHVEPRRVVDEDIGARLFDVIGTSLELNGVEKVEGLEDERHA